MAIDLKHSAHCGEKVRKDWRRTNEKVRECKRERERGRRQKEKGEYKL